MDGILQKNHINDYRLENTETQKAVIKKFDYGEYVKDMTEKDLASNEFLAYNSTHIRKVRGRLKLNVPVFVSCGKKAIGYGTRAVRWQLCTRDKYLNEITVSEGLITADYEENAITYIGDIKLITPMLDAIGVLKLYLLDGETEQIIMRNFMLFDIAHRKNNIYCPDFSDIIVNGFENAKIIGDNDVYYAEGCGTVCALVNKHDIPDYTYKKGIEIAFEATAIKNNATIKLYVNNILIDTKVLKKPSDISHGILSKQYLRNNEDLNKVNCGYLFKVVVPSFACKGLPKNFSVRIETDGGLVLFSRKSGRYPLGFEIKAVD